MTVMPMARDREKNICPPAAESTPRKSSLNIVKLGANINFSPSTAPGRVRARTMTMTSMTNRAGIPTLLKRSMPSLMPPRMIKKQMAMNRNVNSRAMGWSVSML